LGARGRCGGVGVPDASGVLTGLAPLAGELSYLVAGSGKKLAGGDVPRPAADLSVMGLPGADEGGGGGAGGDPWPAPPRRPSAAIRGLN
jgi:hypothetical protein